MNLADLYDLLPQYESVTLTEILERNWFDEIKRNPDRPSLIRATVRTMGWKPLFTGLLLLPYVSRGKPNSSHFISISIDIPLDHSTDVTHISNGFFRTMFNHAHLACMAIGYCVYSYGHM